MHIGSDKYFPSPLMCLGFQVIAVDETQKIEGERISAALYMSSRYKATYRISISGTPIATNRLADLQSLCYFLQIHPLGDVTTWSKLFSKPIISINPNIKTQWLYELFSRITIRRTKAMVKHELNMKDKSFITRTLKFSAFEVRIGVLLEVV